MGDFGLGIAIGPGAVFDREFSVEMSMRTFWAASMSVLVNLDLDTVTTGLTILALALVTTAPRPLPMFSLLLLAPAAGNLGILVLA